MVDDTAVAQARVLLDALYEHVAEVSERIEAAERRGRPTSARGAGHHHRHESVLRRDLYEAHRLIDGLHRRFPETRDPSQARSAGGHPCRVVTVGRRARDT